MRLVSYSISLILVLLFWSSASLGLNSVMFTNQNSTSTPGNESNSLDILVKTPKRDSDGHIKDYYDFNISIQEIYTPTSFSAVSIPKTTFTTVPFQTTLYTNEYNLLYEYHTLSQWLLGIGFNYSRQQAAGTPNVFTNQWELDFGRTIEYGKSGHLPTATVNNEDEDFVTSWDWKLTATYGPIQADSYSVPAVTKIGTHFNYPAGQATINQTGLTLTLGWDPWEWLSASAHYESFAYDNDPNLFASLKSPKAGLPTSLNSYESGLDLTWHLGDDWDLETKTVYSQAATSDNSISVDNTFLLTYAMRIWEVSAGYDQLSYTNAADVDSAIVAIKFLL